MTTLADKAILSSADNRPSMLEKDMYDSWKSIMELYMMNRQHGRMILESVENGPLIWPSIEENGVTRPKKYFELSATKAIQADCDIKATNIILQGLPPEATVQNSNSSAQQDALILSVIEQLKTQVVNCTKINLENKSVNDTLTVELERYKERVKVLKEGQNVDLRSNDNISDSSAQSVKIDRLKQTLSEHLKEKESLMQTITILKNDFKKEESRNIDREIALEKRTKQLNNINPFYLKKAQQLEPKLYVGNVIEKTNANVIPDSKETLMIAEESHFVTRFVPQTELSAEQAFWSKNSVNSPEPTLSSRPTKVEVPKELPKVSMVNTSLKKLKYHLAGFDMVVKERTTPTTITEGSWGPNVFHQMKQAVEQHHLESKTFEVKMNQVLNENERLLEQVINKDIVNIIMNSSVDIASVNVQDSSAQSVEIDRLKQTLSEHLKEKESLMQTLKPKLFNGNAIKNTSAIVIPDSELDPNALLNRPTKVEVPKELPKVSMVNTSLKKLKYHLAGFDVVVKERTTPTAITEGSWGFEHTKACVEQHRVESKTFEVKMNQVLNENERLLEQVINKDIVNIIMNSFVDNVSVNVHECEKCLKLETELLNKKDFVEKEIYDKLFKSFTTLEKHCISLEVDTQLNQEIFQRDNSVSNQSAPSFDQLFELNKLKAQSQEKDTVIKKLKERIKSLRVELIAENEHLKQTYKQLYDSIKPARIRSKEQCDDLINQVNLKSVEISDLNASLQEKVLEITALKDDLRKLKGKALVDNVVTKHTIDPEMLKIDVEPITPKLLNKKTAHSAYIKHTQEEATVLRDLVEHVKSKYPLDHSLESACRITTTTEVPLRKPTALENETPKPVVTLVYSRKPRKSKTNVLVSKSKVLKSVSANKNEPSTVKFRNDHVAKILGYGDYQIGNVTILRVYYVEGLGHNLFSVGQFYDSNLEVAFR
ncbi:hypothetical protein Tco_0795581 [Tanacetum coccineum]